MNDCNEGINGLNHDPWAFVIHLAHLAEVVRARRVVGDNILSQARDCALDSHYGRQDVLILTLRDPPRPGPAHPREHGDSAAPKSLDPRQ